MAKDFTKFKIKDTETWLPKNRLVLSCLQQFFKDVIVGDYSYLKETWPDEIQGGAGIIVALEEVTNERYYFMDDILTAPDNKKYVVCNQWGSGNFEKFTKLAATMGYPIVSNQSELTSDTIENESDHKVNPESNLQENYFKEYFSKDGEELELVINIYGRMHQLFQCKKEVDDEIDEIENHYENSYSAFFKIDSDNLISIELNNEKIFEGEVLELGINENDLEQVADLDKITLANISNTLENIPTSKCFNEIDLEEIYVSTKSNLMVVSEGSLDYGRQLKFAPNFENRYTMIEYGKYHIQTIPIKLKSFKITDLFFQKDTCIEDLLGPATEGIYYCFSKIFHFELKELEYEIQQNNVKSTDFAEGWISDY